MFCCGPRSRPASESSPAEKPSSNSPSSSSPSSPPPSSEPVSPASASPAPSSSSPSPNVQSSSPASPSSPSSPSSPVRADAVSPAPSNPAVAAAAAANPPSPKNQKGKKQKVPEAAVMSALFGEVGSQKWVTVAKDKNEPDPDEVSSGGPSTVGGVSTASVASKDRVGFSIMDEKLKSSGLVFSPLQFSSAEKSLLRDNMTAVLMKDMQPKFLRMSHEQVKVGSYLGAALRLVHKDHAYHIKRIHFDRPLMHHGLLYFIEGKERDSVDTFHIWLLIRLVMINDGVAQINIPPEVKGINKKTKKEEVRPLVSVHDWNCKNCRRQKPCDHKFKAVEKLTEYTIGFYIQFPVRLEGALYLHCLTLNSRNQAALSSRIYLSKRSAEAGAEKSKEKGKEKAPEVPKPRASRHEGAEGGSEVTYCESEEDSAVAKFGAELNDDDTFYEQTSSSFVKASPSPANRSNTFFRQGASESSHNTGEEDDDDDEVGDQFESESESGESGREDEDEEEGTGAVAILDTLREQTATPRIKREN